MQPCIGLIPRTSPDAIGAARPIPIPPIKAFLGIYGPLQDTGVVGYVPWLVSAFPIQNHFTRAVLGTFLASLTEILDSDVNRFIRLQWQVG